MTAVDADFGQHVEQVIDRGEPAARPRCGLTESAEVLPCTSRSTASADQAGSTSGDRRRRHGE